MEKPVRWCFLQHFMRNICIACLLSFVSKCWCLYLFVSLFILSCQWYVSWIRCSSSSSSSSWLGGLGRIFGACAGGHGLRDGEPAENMGSLNCRFEMLMTMLIISQLFLGSTILSHSLVSEIWNMCQTRTLPETDNKAPKNWCGRSFRFLLRWRNGANWKVLRELFGV